MSSHPQTRHQPTERVSDAELLVGVVLIGLILLLTSTLVPLFA